MLERVQNIVHDEELPRRGLGRETVLVELVEPSLGTRRPCGGDRIVRRNVHALSRRNLARVLVDPGANAVELVDEGHSLKYVRNSHDGSFLGGTYPQAPMVITMRVSSSTT